MKICARCKSVPVSYRRQKYCRPCAKPAQRELDTARHREARKDRPCKLLACQGLAAPRRQYCSDACAREGERISNRGRSRQRIYTAEQKEARRRAAREYWRKNPRKQRKHTADDRLIDKARAEAREAGRKIWEVLRDWRAEPDLVERYQRRGA